jgi:hypothetical protein
MGQEVFDVSEEVPVEDEWIVVRLVFEDDEPATTAVMAVVVVDGGDVVDAVAVLELAPVVQVEGERRILWSRKTE